MVEFLHRALGLDIAGVEPTEHTGLEERDIGSAVGRGALVLVLGDLELFPKVLVEGVEGNGSLGGFHGRDSFFVNREGWVVAFVHEEWGHVGGRVRGVVVGKFR